jgi:hypothetical protein
LFIAAPRRVLRRVYGIKWPLAIARVTRAGEILERQTVLSSPMLCARFDVRDFVTALTF